MNDSKNDPQPIMNEKKISSKAAGEEKILSREDRLREELRKNLRKRKSQKKDD